MSCMRPLSAVLACAVLADGLRDDTGRRGLPAREAADPAQLTQWMAKGRIALVAQGEGGSGSFVWQQRSERTELTVRGPLGAGGLALVTDGESIELADGAGQPLDGEAARAELERRLGVKLPLAELRYWMLGVPAPEPSGSGPVQASTRLGAWLRPGRLGGQLRGAEAAGGLEPARAPDGHDQRCARENRRRRLDPAGAMNRALGYPAPWPAPGKLNLFLHVVGRRPDGYHELQTAFQFIDLWDSIRFYQRPPGVIERLGTLPGVAGRG